MARAIVRAMTGNPWFPSPVPPLLAVEAAIEALAVAQTATRTRTLGAVALRDEKRLALITLLQQLGVHVQARADADVENAASIIEGAGMSVKRRSVPAARVFAAKRGKVSGSVTLVAPKAGNRAGYEWAYSTEELLTTLNQSHPPSTSPVSCQARSPFTRIASASRRRSPRTASSTGRAAAPPLA